MKPGSICLFGAAAAAILLISAALAAPPDAAPKDEVVPLIVIDDVPLTLAIRNLARQAGINNYILDPRVPGSGFTAGKEVPSVSFRRENVSAREALNDVLKQHKLAIIANPATTVARIAPTNLAVKPIPANPALTGANEVVLVMDDVPLADALRNVARQSYTYVTIDPRLSEPSFNRGGMVSVRWEKLTARQALAALLDNYDLVMTEDEASSSAQIKLNPLNWTDPAPKGEPEKKQP
jgi:hypothetical protein